MYTNDTVACYFIKKLPAVSKCVIGDYKTSRGWFENFKRCIVIHFVSCNGECESLEKAGFEIFLKRDLRWNGMKLNKCDEMDIFWKKMTKEDDKYTQGINSARS